MRVASVTSPSLVGTLKSTRTNTRLPAQSRCCTVFLAKLMVGPSYTILRSASTTRFEKPHSLSYHDMTLTMSPLTT